MYQILYPKDEFIKNVLSLIESGNYKKVDFLLKKHPLKSVCASRRTLLHYFVECGSEKIVQYLIYKNYDVNAQDLFKITPLMIATKQKKEATIEVLLVAGADVMIVNYEDKSALDIVFEEQYFTAETSELFFYALLKKFPTYKEVAHTLMNAGCQLYQACYFKDARIIKYMLEHGLSVNSTEPVYKESSLHLAVRFEDVDTVKVLLKYGADINAVNIQGSTPLNYVHPGISENPCKKVEILNILLNLGVPTTSCNNTGLFQISTTLMLGKCEAIRAVLQSNIDFTAKDQTNEKNFLHYLATNANPGIAEELKQCRCKYNVNQVDKSNISTLHLAVKYCNVQMVKFLLDQGANPNHVIKGHGQTPLYYAFAKFKDGFEDEYNQCVQMLLQKNADPQCIITNIYNKQITIFDVAGNTNSFERLKPVIAHLAILEKLGIPIEEIISKKMDSFPVLKQYFNVCRKINRKKIFGSVTLFQLLTSDKKKMARYSGNRDLMLKLKRLKYKQNVCFLYYYSILKKNIKEGIQHRRLLNEAAKVMCKFFKDCFHRKNVEVSIDARNIVIDNIIHNLNDDCLQQMYHLSKEMKM